MATIDPASWEPDWAVTPGELLLETLEEREISQSELARRMGRPTKTINEIVNGKAAITPETAIQLERTLGISAGFWNRLEGNYRQHLARERSLAELEAKTGWADRFPISDLVKFGLVTRGKTKGQTTAALLSFFGVGSPEAWETQWRAPAAAFRSSPTFSSSPESVAAWLRWGELMATGAECPPFNAQRLRAAVDEIRGLTRQADFMQTVEQIRSLLAAAGVVFVLVPELGGTRLSGAARWLTHEKALIQITMRHKSNDQFWFSLLHEVGHLLGRRRQDFIDPEDGSASTDEAEVEADRFARELLIPEVEYERFVAIGAFDEQAVREFARAVNIAPGIVVGRLQRDNHLNKSHLNGLKKTIPWATLSRN